MENQFPVNLQLKAACTVYWWRASQILNFKQAGRVNDVPDGKEFTKRFTFSPIQLHDYLVSRPEAVNAIYNEAVGNRGMPNAYFIGAQVGWEVGWFDGNYSAQRYHLSKVDAATDYVLLFWGMGRWQSEGDTSIAPDLLTPEG